MRKRINQPKISIIVPVYKSELYLKRCIESILNQTFSDFELLLIDDGSPDNSGNICDTLALVEPRIKVFHKNNEGASSARRLGISASIGEFLLFIDSDDYIALNTLELLVSELKDNNIDIVISNFNIVGINKTSYIKQNMQFGHKKIHLISSLLTSAILSSLCGRLIKRNLFNDIVMLDHLKIGEDSIIMYQILGKTDKVKIIDKPLYYYVQHSESAMHSTSFEFLKSHLEYCKWIISFVEDNFTEKNSVLLKDSISYFVLNEYYGFLRDGGKPILDKKFSKLVFNYYLNNTTARRQFPKWRRLLIVLYKISPVLGNIYRYVIVKSRNVSNKYFR